MTVGSGPPASPAALAGTTLGTCYAFEQLLGQGRHGATYDARHVRLGQHYVVRVLSIESNRQAAIIGALSQYATIVHPNLAPAHDVLPLSSDQLAICTPLLAGVDLNQRVASQGKLTVAEGSVMLRQTASALHALHELGLVHGNLSAGNVFFTTYDDVSVDNVLGSSKGGQIVQLLDAGLHLSELQVGKAPPSAADDQRALGKLALSTVADLSPGQKRVLDRTQQERGESRYPSMLAMWEAFEGAKAPGRAAQSGAMSTALVPQIRLGRGMGRAGDKRRAMLIAAAGLVGLSAVGLLVILMSGRGSGGRSATARGAAASLVVDSEVHIAFDVTPQVATVTINGRTTPASSGLTLPRGSEPVSIILSASGYQPKAMTFVPSGARTISVALEKGGVGEAGDGSDGDDDDKKRKHRERRRHKKDKPDGADPKAR